MAEEADLKSVQCPFESDQGHAISSREGNHMQKHKHAKCGVCKLPPSYHSINSKAYRVDADGQAVLTDKPPHSFAMTGR